MPLVRSSNIIHNIRTLYNLLVKYFGFTWKRFEHFRREYTTNYIYSLNTSEYRIIISIAMYFKSIDVDSHT